MTNFIELATRCEAATGPDRDLDGAIATEMGEARNYEGDGVYGCKRYTGSLDAAMTLMPATTDMERPLIVSMSVSESGNLHWAAVKNWKWGRVETLACKTRETAFCAVMLRLRAVAISSRERV